MVVVMVVVQVGRSCRETVKERGDDDDNDDDDKERDSDSECE
jgi:hypothetical protein